MKATSTMVPVAALAAVVTLVALAAGAAAGGSPAKKLEYGDVFSGKTVTRKVWDAKLLANAVEIDKKQWTKKQVEMKKPLPSFGAMIDKVEAGAGTRARTGKTSTKTSTTKEKLAGTTGSTKAASATKLGAPRGKLAGGKGRRQSVFAELAAATSARAAWCDNWGDKNVDTLRGRFVNSRTPAADDDWTETNNFEYEMYTDGTPKVAYGWASRNTVRAYNGVGYRSGMRDFTKCWFDKQPTHTNDIDCGHIIADSLGGTPRNTANFFPQERDSNQNGVWYKQEAYIRSLIDGGGASCKGAHDVFLSVQFDYDGLKLVPGGGTYGVYLSKRCLDQWNVTNAKKVTVNGNQVYGFLESKEKWVNK